ncbi:hypothetical protein AAFF_G00193560 [Aldrovandia affinis]|uniref:Ig-like domain-containing protein n=1 Tax=Aldrovandia affinis TaxID=143900 RepID=A0AAD7SYI5_9TELE|nr:hypothetical protein AAFF_G00193560 [Aldrovandia affinis]
MRLFTNAIICFILMCLPCEAGEQIHVQNGETVTLNCSFSTGTETLWMKQNPKDVPTIILSAGRNSDQEGMPEESHYTAFIQNSSVSLRINNVTSSDFALYYCCGRSGGQFKFGQGFVLHGDGEMELAEKCEKGPHCGQCEVCTLYWRLLVVTASFCIILSSICLYFIYYRKGTTIAREELQSKGKRTANNIQV